MFLNILSFCLVLLEALFFFNLLIVVHEWGHFLAARWRGAIIEEFGIWFGKPIWKRKYNGVWYSFGSIPFGGFVKLPQLGNKAIEGDAETADLPPLRPLDRIIVAFAGPLFSFLLALVLATLVWAVGRPTYQFSSTTTIGGVTAGGPAAQAGLLPGDKILTIDGKPVTRFDGMGNSVIWRIISSEGPKIEFVVERQGKQVPISCGFRQETGSALHRKPKRQVGIGPLFVPTVGGLIAKGPGEAAGLQIGDVVTAVNGQPILSLGQLDEIVKAAPQAPLQLTLKRGAGTAEATLQPGKMHGAGEEAFPELGITWGALIVEHPGPWPQIRAGVVMIRDTVTAIASRKSDVQLKDMSSPVGILNVYYHLLTAEEGWRLAISFSVIFNVNLALINLLPFPVLDGGHITFGLIELVRRKPTNGRFLEIIETACVFVILGYMLFVIFFDVGDLLPHARSKGLQGPSITPVPGTVAP